MDKQRAIHVPLEQLHLQQVLQNALHVHQEPIGSTHTSAKNVLLEHINHSMARHHAKLVLLVQSLIKDLPSVLHAALGMHQTPTQLNAYLALREHILPKALRVFRALLELTIHYLHSHHALHAQQIPTILSQDRIPLPTVFHVLLDHFRQKEQQVAPYALLERFHI